MAQTTEASGRTLDEAKKAAAEALGVSIDECEFEVLEEASKGLFAKTNYRVKATLTSAPKAKSPGKAAVEVPAKKPREPRGEKEGDEFLPEPVADKEDADVASLIVGSVLDNAGLNIKVKVDNLGGKYVNLELSGPDVDELTANRGAALDSLQYLSNAMLGRTRANGVRLTLDAANYRSQRASTLEKLALEVATAVKERKQEAVLDSLPAHERRVIHNALKEFDGVETYSEGEEPERRVVISPKK